MAKNKNLCQSNDRISKKTVLSYLGIHDINNENQAFDKEFNNAFEVGLCKKTSNNDTNATKKLFYKMCLSDWDIVSYDSTTGAACIAIHGPVGDVIIGLNLKTSNF
jgi:hypothetical protein